MLTLFDFNGLTESEKADAVWQATFLADREADGLMVQLYGLPNFYVEVFYDAKTNNISHFEAFTSRNRLVPYLAQIKFN